MIVEAVAHDEVIADFKAHIVGLHLRRAHLVLGQKHRSFDSHRALVHQPPRHRMQRSPGVENVIEQQNLMPLHLGKMTIQKIHHARTLHTPMVTRHIQTLDLQHPRHPPQKIGRKHQCALEQNDHHQRPLRKIPLNLRSHRIKPLLNHRFIDQHALNVIPHAPK